jgi:hypothetical protein
MYRINEAAGALVGVWTDGRLSAEDQRALTAELEERVAAYGRLRLLFRADHADGWDASACAALRQFGCRHAAHIERLAVVGERHREAWARSLAACVLAPRARYFPAARLGEAWGWLQRTHPEPDERGLTPSAQ